MNVPAVYKDGSHTAILVEVGRKNVRYIAMTARTLGVTNRSIEEFNKMYKEFEYPLVNAVTHFLEHSKTHGSTVRALTYLRVLEGAQCKENKMASEDTVVDQRSNAKSSILPTTKLSVKESLKAAAENFNKTVGARTVEKVKPSNVKKDTIERKQGRNSAFSPRMKITVLVDKNPKRAGSNAASRFDLYKKNNTVEKFLAAGGLAADLRWDSKQNYISVV